MLKINSNSVIRAAFGAVMYTFINYFVCEISCVIRTPAGLHWFYLVCLQQVVS